MDRPVMSAPIVSDRMIAALQALELDYPVVAVKFTAEQPAEMRRLDKHISLCAMLREAQISEPFFASQDEQGCAPGSYVLGQIAHDPVMESGRIGPEIGVYESPAANRRVYEDMIRFPEGAFPYTLFARLGEGDLAFDPDLLVITATPSQAEVVLRAHGYASGAGWEARGTTVIGCASLYAYPYVTGKLNVLISGLHHGMRARQLFPQGLLFIAVPRPLIAETLENLATMVDKGLIDLPQYHWGGEYHAGHMRGIMERLAQEPDPATTQDERAATGRDERGA